jgi:hypothetical protein
MQDTKQADVFDDPETGVKTNSPLLSKPRTRASATPKSARATPLKWSTVAWSFIIKNLIAGYNKTREKNDWN